MMELVPLGVPIICGMAADMKVLRDGLAAILPRAHLATHGAQFFSFLYVVCCVSFFTVTDLLYDWPPVPLHRFCALGVPYRYLLGSGPPVGHSCHCAFWRPLPD